ncbi:hypothetical protein FRC18_009508 [Serendipita sp. 400]|nr:hypothetical protein FRC18_009508 [Serendipita sp. 400]
MTPFTPPMAAFAFDIDGVLTQGSNALPQAKRILNYLSGYNPWKLNFPFVLITNGGGKPERDRCTELSNLLETKIDEDMFMQSHTVVGSRVLPYLDQYQTKPILVLGGAGDTCRLIAQDYGFRDVLIPADVFCWNKDIWPLHTPTQEEQQIARVRYSAVFKNPNHSAFQQRDFDFSEKPIAAAFVFHDPRNWAPDVQILLDIVRYGSQTLPAFVGRRGDRGQHHSTEGDKRVELVFCNPDLVWRGAYPEPRLGQGGFRYAFQSIHTALEGKPYNATILGKPSTETYRHAENMIMNLSSRAYGTNIPKSSM